MPHWSFTGRSSITRYELKARWLESQIKSQMFTFKLARVIARLAPSRHHRAKSSAAGRNWKLAPANWKRSTETAELSALSTGVVTACSRPESNFGRDAPAAFTTGFSMSAEMMENGVFNAWRLSMRKDGTTGHEVSTTAR